ncbi:MAG: autotransporter outer membrane beta-barrel domain-containing protein, partial [Sphingomicrobium sp.]
MKTSHRRFALLTGASIAALGISAPALAAPHDALTPGTYPGFTTTDDTIELCDLATPAGDPCFFGIIDEGSPTSTAVVSLFSNGEFRQQPTGTTAVMNNGASAEVGAIASATGSTFANATASALFVGYQVKFAGTGDADLTINNTGSLLMDAVAHASATSGAADANARVENALHQAATGSSVSLAIVNDGSLAFLASANATGTSAANANATVSTAIYQHGTGATVALSLANNSVLDIGANATAVASGTVDATAEVNNAIDQFASATAGDASITAVNVGTIAIHATAAATGDAYAGAFINGGILQHAVAGASITEGGTSTIGLAPAFATSLGSDAFVGMTNSGAISMTASAAAHDTLGGSATATASITNAIVQSATATGNAGASYVNSGSIALNAIAAATADSGSAYAYAYIYGGIEQNVSGGGTGSAFASNSGTIALNATATAVGTAYASASASVTGGISQVVNAGSTAYASAYNSGSIALNANANASGSSAYAFALASDGIYQAVSGASAVTAVASNSGAISLSANATAVAASGLAQATASASSGIEQHGSFASTANLVINNNGLVALNANALASGAGSASAYAYAYSALYQAASFVSSANVSISNGSTLSAHANATAIANGTVTGVGTTATTVGDATASAYAAGMGQGVAFAGAANLSMTNSGLVDVSANASASGIDFAYAYASATGAWQEAFLTGPSTFTFSNSGNLNVAAHAVANVATGSSATASAYAYGYTNFSLGGDQSLSFENTANGSINVTASATAPAGTAYAYAIGASVEALGSGTGTGALTGTLDNAGAINVVAHAAGGTFTTVVGTGTTAVTNTFAKSTATATGILVDSGLTSLTINNSGSINVDAITENGGSTTANGIIVVSNGTGGIPALTDILTINNSGGLIVRQSGDGGASWTRGMAIDVSQAPNPSVINLLGGGNIYGNIDINSGDVINVDNGETAFDGIINPEFLPVGGVTEADLDTGLFGQGPLNITADGALFLRNRADEAAFANSYDGPSYAFVESLNLEAGATLIYELPTSNTGGTQPVGTYPQIFTDTADITDGNLLVRPSTANGLFADNYFYDNVIDSNALTGTFDTCGLDGTYSDSAFLTLTCIYDASDNVDLGITRTPFNGIPGLTHNQQSTSDGLECIFDPTLTGGMADVLADLFTFNATDYAEALDQLAGAAYASYLQSFNSLGVHYNDILAKATDCEVPALAGSVLECRTSPTHVWAQIDFQTRKSDGDAEAGHNDADRWTAVLGVDMNVGNAGIVGASVGKVTNRLTFNQSNNRIKADGYQVGLYGVYDPGAFYLKALGTYSWFNGDSKRNIDFRPFGGTVVGQLQGNPDVNLWTLGLHGGYRIAMGAASVVTPYLNLDYTNTKLKGFTEGGLVGPELTVYGSTEKRTTLTGGVKWASDIGGVVPEVDLGYRYQFGPTRSNFDAAFLGDNDCAFDIISEGGKRGAFLAGLSLGGKAGPVDVRVSYQGLFNGDV